MSVKSERGRRRGREKKEDSRKEGERKKWVRERQEDGKRKKFQLAQICNCKIDMAPV